MVCLFYFHSFCQDCNPTCPENHMQKGSLFFLQEIDYKKADATNDKLVQSQLNRFSLCNKASFI